MPNRKRLDRLERMRSDLSKFNAFSDIKIRLTSHYGNEVVEFIDEVWSEFFFLLFGTHRVPRKKLDALLTMIAEGSIFKIEYHIEEKTKRWDKKTGRYKIMDKKKYSRFRQYFINYKKPRGAVKRNYVVDKESGIKQRVTKNDSVR